MLLLWETLVRDVSSLLWGVTPEPEPTGVGEMLLWGILVCAVSSLLWVITPEPETIGVGKMFMRVIKLILAIVGAPVWVPLGLILWALGFSEETNTASVPKTPPVEEKVEEEKEKGMKSVNEMRFAILGPSGAGKTTLLACMAEEFERVSPGTIFPADASTFGTLNKAYKSLVRDANDSSTRNFERSIEGTSMLRGFLFHIKGHRAVLPVRFCDFPGGWIIPDHSNNKIVIDIVKNSAVIIVVINTPYLMEFDGKYIDDGCAVDEIEWVIKRSLEGDASERLILFVPIKCEKYLETPELRDNLHKSVRRAFEKTLMLTSNPLYTNRLAIALLPVQTVGNAEFMRFKFASDGRVEREVYRKPDPHSHFSPQNVDQPMRYLMSFLLEQFVRNKEKGSWYKKFLSFIFREGDLREVAEYIRSGIKSDNDLSAGFKIFCGRELIGFPSGR